MITDEFLERVEQYVGMGAAAWDCIDPKEIIAGVLAVHRIVRDGETEFAALYRRRSGQDSMQIEYGISLSEIDKLSDSDRQELLLAARGMVREIVKYCHNPVAD